VLSGDRCLGAHEKLTTCARIELTTPKNRLCPVAGPSESRYHPRRGRVSPSLYSDIHKPTSFRAATPRGSEPENLRRESRVGGQLLVSRGG